MLTRSSATGEVARDVDFSVDHHSRSLKELRSPVVIPIDAAYMTSY